MVVAETDKYVSLTGRPWRKARNKVERGAAGTYIAKNKTRAIKKKKAMHPEFKIPEIKPTGSRKLMSSERQPSAHLLRSSEEFHGLKKCGQWIDPKTGRFYHRVCDGGVARLVSKDQSKSYSDEEDNEE